MKVLQRKTIGTIKMHTYAYVCYIRNFAKDRVKNTLSILKLCVSYFECTNERYCHKSGNSHTHKASIYCNPRRASVCRGLSNHDTRVDRHRLT